MIDRSYLPFKSARDYQDSKMQKWVGFFLSEHNSALDDDKQKKTFHSQLTLEDKFLLLSQLYSQQLTGVLIVIEGNELKTYQGLVSSVNRTNFLIKTDQGFEKIELDNIFDIELVEEVDSDESA